MAYVSAEQTEEPAKHEHQYVPASLPAFKKQDNPLGNIQGSDVFCQDEGSKIASFKFAEDPAAAVLMGEVETCRQSHQGHVLRQRVTVERCSLVEYHYRHGGKTHSIFLNPTHNLVEDLSGPVQEAIENMDALAQKAFDETRYEDAYRLNMRALCMEQATDAETNLRDRVLKRLTAAYRSKALLAWLICALSWLLVGAVLPKPRLNLGPLLALLPLLAGVRLFARDVALRFKNRSSRRLAAVLIGVAAFFSGMSIDSHVSNLLPLFAMIIALVIVAIARAPERSRRCRIEKCIKNFPNTQALEAYVGTLDPSPGSDGKGILLLSVCCVIVVAAVGVSQALARLEERIVAEANAEALTKAQEREEAPTAPLLAAASAEAPGKATRDRAWKNSLGMVFMPVPGTKVLFSVWKTRVRDYAAYAEASPNVDMGWKQPGFPDADGKALVFQQGSMHPVVTVSWEDAKGFCAWLTRKEQASGMLGQNQKYRLPTDGEWSMAVGLPDEGPGTPREKFRRNQETLVFPWGGGEWPPPRGVANYDSTNFDDFEYTSPVWAFRPNAFGLYDLGGNAHEWCEDEIDWTQHTNSDQMERVLRGGAWSSQVWRVMSSYYRSSDRPSLRRSDNGFRCVLVLEDQRP